MSYNCNMFANPVENLKSFGLREDMVVADLGAGSGFYAIPAARMVPNGKVYAVEIQKDFLTTVRNKAAEAHLGNLECIWGDIEKIGGTKIKDKIVDAVIASNVLFQVEDKNKFIDEIKRILKPGGKLFLIDWSDIPVSPVPSARAISQAQARRMFENKGFAWERDISAEEHHYGMIFKSQ